MQSTDLTEDILLSVAKKWILLLKLESLNRSRKLMVC